MKKFITYIVIIALLSVSVLGDIGQETGNQGHPFSEIWPDDETTYNFGGGIISNTLSVIATQSVTANEFCIPGANPDCITSWPSGNGGDGSVTSVGISMPDGFSVSNSPITDSGEINIEWVGVNSGLVFAAPALCSGDCSPGFRLLLPQHIPNLTASKITSGYFSVARGGTGRSSLTSGSILFGAGTSNVGLDSNLYWDDTNKRLGIGTNSPQTKLHVSKTSNGYSSIIFEEGESGNNKLIFRSPQTHYGTNHGQGNMSGRIYTTERDLRLSANGVRNQLVLDTNENVGIGTSDPTSKLHVTGDIQAVGIYHISDKSLKKNISLISNPIEKISKLEGVSFNWIENNKSSIGLIAQDVEKIIPEIVRGEEGSKSVDYANLVAVLIEAVKEQQQQIDELTLEVEKLKQ